MLKTLPYVLAVFAPLRATAAPQASWLSCAATPRNLFELDRGAVWPEGDVVVVEGFVKSVQDQDDNQHSITIQSKSGASDVLVVTPLDTDVAAFSSDFVRVQGLAHSVAGQRVMGLQEGGTTVGGIVACPPPMHGMPRKLAQDCGGGGQPVCPDDIAATRTPPWECDFGFVGGPDGTCVPFVPPPDPPAPPLPPPTPPAMMPGGPAPPGGIPCNIIVPGVDLFGGDIFPVPPVPPPTASNEECLQSCLDTPGCNAFSRALDSGACFLKNVPETFPAVSTADRASLRFCPGDPPVVGGVPTAPSPGGTGGAGAFGPPIPFPVVPVAIALLPNGEVLAWSGAGVDAFGGGPAGVTFFATFNPATNTAGPAQQVAIGHDMFCPGIAQLPNGNIMVVGGSAGGDGAGSTSIWDGSWSSGPPLNIMRGYNSAVTLANGDVFTLGGSFSGIQSMDKGGETFSFPAGPWSQTTSILGEVINSDDPQGMFRTDNYGFFFAWTGNSVFHAGPSTQMNWFTSLDGAGVVTPAGVRGPTAMNGNAVMFAQGQILAVGGAPSFSLGDGARSGAELITLGAPGAAPTVQAIPGPAVGRTYAMSVVLPDGKVGHFGGATTAVEFSDDTAVFAAEIWDPATLTWTTDASAIIPRTYHSAALLVPDGRVMVGGGGLCGGGCAVNHLDAEMYSPGYLFNADGSPAPRPTITLSGGAVAPGGTFTVTSSTPLSMVSMIRMGTSTHSANTDQRRLELCGGATAACGGASATVTVPGAGIAIPGVWMIFGLNDVGTPSVASLITVT